jgi:hypothetical protein
MGRAAANFYADVPENKREQKEKEAVKAAGDVEVYFATGETIMLSELVGKRIEFFRGTMRWGATVTVQAFALDQLARTIERYGLTIMYPTV